MQSRYRIRSTRLAGLVAICAAAHAGTAVQAQPQRPTPPAVQPAAPPTPSRPVFETPTWLEMVDALADRTALPRMFAERPAPATRGAYMLFAEVLPGVDQVAFDYYSLGDTAWTMSPGRYSPASAVKVPASLCALWTLKRHGLTARAHVQMTGTDHAYSGTVLDLVHRAIVYSDNEAYCVLMRIAGQREMREDCLPNNGLSDMVLQALFVKGPNPAVGASPEIRFRQGARSGSIPARPDPGAVRGCRDNCVNLVEMQEVIRRVLLHHEIDPQDRWALDPDDLYFMREFLFHARERFGPGPARALGEGVVTYGRFGNIPGMNVFENGLITVKHAGAFIEGNGGAVNVPRYLATASFPYFGKDDTAQQAARKLTSDLTEAALRFLKGRKRSGPVVQRNAGVPIPLVAHQSLGNGTYRMHATFPAGHDGRIWNGRRPIQTRTLPGGIREFDLELADRAPLLVMEARKDGHPVGYRAVRVRLSSPGSAGADVGDVPEREDESGRGDGA